MVLAQTTIDLFSESIRLAQDLLETASWRALVITIGLEFLYNRGAMTLSLLIVTLIDEHLFGGRPYVSLFLCQWNGAGGTNHADCDAWNRFRIVRSLCSLTIAQAAFIAQFASPHPPPSLTIFILY